ncbi:glycerol kinase GlpK [Methylocaldum sp. MU1018]
MPHYIAVVDQGTTSTRCILFDRAGRIAAMAQAEHRQICPCPGRVEHDPLEIWRNTRTVIEEALRTAKVRAQDIAALGVTNQRETVVVWNKFTGNPAYPAIVWQDTRSAGACERLSAEGGQDRFRAKTGLPIATYFSGPKLQWLLDHVDGARTHAERGELLCGTIDSWLIWNLTGGKDGGVHITDVTNASRTLLMNLETLAWDEELVAAMNVPASMLPEIRSSSEIYGIAKGALAGVAIAGNLGDQQAALFGQTCFDAGDAKNTYGTGCFMLLNTGPTPVRSRHGLVTTAAYRLGGAPPVYALEGSIAMAGALVQWLRDNLGLIRTSAEIETLANTVENNGGIYLVPAFSGLFAPYWRSDARGMIIGLTRYVNKGHFARAALEATAYQTRDIVEAMRQETGLDLDALKVDGGMVSNEILMQLQADILGIPIIRPTVTETTALGAAFAAGLAVGFWNGLEELRDLWKKDREWRPRMTPATREQLYAAWKKAVTRTFDWIE